MDLLLDSATWDLSLADGELDTVNAAEEIGQRVAIRLKTHRGEWAYDTSFGVPYRDQIRGRARSLDSVGSVFRAVIAETEGVDEIVSINLTLDKSTRQLTADIVIRTAFGVVSVTA